MKRLWPFALFLVACQSNPFRGFASQKATPSPSRDRVELAAPVAYSPRRSQVLQSAVVLNPGVQNCLRQRLRTEPVHFLVEIEGSVLASGQLAHLNVMSVWPDLKVCLENALSRVQMGSGSLGPFQMRIFLVQSVEPGQKTFLLDLSPPLKKFQ